MLADFRDVTKRVVIKSPVVSAFAKNIYTFVKNSSERRHIARLYPDADFVDYGKQEVDRFRSAGYHSQFGQDHYLWNKIFKSQPKGFFVEVGGSEPFANSNSAFLEKQGWLGIAFEPQQRLASKWEHTRTTPIHVVAISDTEQMRDFVEFDGPWQHQLSGFKDAAEQRNLDLYSYTTYQVACRPLRAFIGASQPVDLLMIDVEGAEEFVLDGVDFDAITPRYIMIENVSEIGGSEKIRRRMKETGYKLIARIGATDDLFQHSN